MTAEEFLEWTQRPENENRWFELVRGEVIELPVPAKIHGRVCINVGFILETYVRQRGFGYITGNDSGVILERDPDTVRGPDVALYEDARIWGSGTV
jgi:Uma2 family endonuclease